MSEPTLIVTSDFTKEFNQIVSRFKRDAVLVGIPESDDPRDGDAPINNATLLAINNMGSPVNNIPPRPVMEIGIRKVQDEVAEQFGLAAREALQQGPSALERRYNRAGFIASSAIKRVINDQEGIEGPSDATLQARKYIGVSGFKGEKALIVTAQMRNAITHVVNSIWGT